MANRFSSLISLDRVKNNLDLFVAVALIVVILMLVIPFPTFVLDLLLVFNLLINLMIILSTIYVKKPAEFSAFPGIILLTTIFGLGLNVTSTRLILTQGAAFDSKVITTFGNFVVGGNYLVGITIFIVIIAIQFFVITKGASRVSEVAARFTLDALPGKQLSINEDLNAGLITEEEARRKRDEVRLEADFYGAMDGASKFVSGNVKVALFITVVDIVVGLITGVVMRGEGISEALRTYTLFTVGDGLVSQIPQLLISTASGIIVTRTAAREKFGHDVVSQIAYAPKVLYISGIVVFLMGFIPGFPILINFMVGGLFIWIGYMMSSREKAEEERQKEIKTKTPTEQVTTVEDIVRIDPINIEIGYNLIPLVDKEQGGDLLERIKLIRKRIGLDLGILVPPIRIVDNVAIDASEYIIKIRGAEVARGKVYYNRFLAMNPKLDLKEIEGLETKEPVFGIDAKWISEEERVKAESLGFDIFDPPSVVATHLTEVIKKFSAELLTRQDVKAMLDAIQKEYPVVVEEVLKHSNIGEIQKILQNLLREGVKIRNMLVILETIADYASSVKNIDLLTEYVRQALGKDIASTHANQGNKLYAILIDPELEELLSDSLQETPQGLISTLDPENVNKFVVQSSNVIENQLKAGIQPVIVSSQKVRRLIRELLGRSYPSIGVLSYSEIPPNFSIEQVGIISI
ncbi:MAG: flagellar biosynthesis protein FlhA [Brevinematales bacterium]|nr:flagellar biosynthesis protein FlhA [Brevinematales bacterium]